MIQFHQSILVEISKLFTKVNEFIMLMLRKLYTFTILLQPSRYFFGYNNKLISKKMVVRPIQQKESTKMQNVMKVYDNKDDIILAQKISTLPLKQFSIKIHQLLVRKQKSEVFWTTVEKSFLERLQPTIDPIIIRSYAKIVYTLSKSKQATNNYETQMGLILPFATPASFTTIITAISRIAPYSAQFGYIVELLYYRRKSQFKPRELVSVNYSLAHNGRKCDQKLIQKIDCFNCVETITMLRCYDLSNLVTKQLLTTILMKLKAVKLEFNVLDLADCLNIYLKHGYHGNGYEELIQESYQTLKRNVNDVCLEKIWEYIPASLNAGILRIRFVEEVISTILILRKGRNLGQIAWHRLQPTFRLIDNLELRLRLQKIY